MLHNTGVRQPVMYEIAEIIWDGEFVGDVVLVTTDSPPRRIVLPDGSLIVRVTAR